MDEVTDWGNLVTNTHFLLSTSYLSDAFKEAYEFITTFIPKDRIYLDVSYPYGGYVIKEFSNEEKHFEKYYHHIEDKDRHFKTLEIFRNLDTDDGWQKDREDYLGKSLSIVTNFQEGEMPCSSTVVPTSLSLQEYVKYLDASPLVGTSSRNQSPGDFWGHTVDDAPKGFWWIAVQMHEHFMKWRSEQENYGKHPPLIFYIVDEIVPYGFWNFYKPVESL